MSRVTLIWVSRDGSSSRVLAVPRLLVLGLMGGLLLALAACGASLWWIQGLSRELAVRTGENRELADRVARAGAALLVERDRAQGLLEETRTLEEEFGRVRETENKIRRFLGLNEQPADPERAHQGGTGAPGAFVEEPGHARPASLLPRGNRPGVPGDLGEGLGEVLSHLEQRREELRTVPTLLPATSPKVWLSCAFGWREDPFSGTGREFHNGIDVAGPWKDPVVAPADGKVLRVGKDRLLGVYVKIQHNDRIKTLYGHLESAAVEAGDRVQRGEVIGHMGNTGRSTGTHLHYSVAVDDKYVNPLEYVWDRPFRTIGL